MERPHATRDRMVADAARRSAAEHAARAAQLSRRAAATRRRALLTVVLVVAAAAGWVGAAAAGATLLAGLVPTVALVAVLGLGRRAVRDAARADAAWEAGAADRLPAAPVVGRAVRPCDATTQVLPRVPAQTVRPSAATRHAPADARTTAPVRAAATADTSAVQGSWPVRRSTAEPVTAGRGASSSVVPAVTMTVAETTTAAADVPVVEESGAWAPVPVPRPTYTLKPAARRAEPAPLGDLSAPARAAEEIEDSGTAGADVVAAAVPASAPASRAGLDLDAILARRRASGE